MTKILTLTQVVNLTAHELIEYVNTVVDTKFVLPIITAEQSDFFKLADYIITFASQLTALSAYNDWLSQPFKPELITELFDKIGEIYYYETHFDEDLERVAPNSGWAIIISDLYDNIGYYDYKTMGCRRSPKPRTLNDFVNDCGRCGLELYLKEKK